MTTATDNDRPTTKHRRSTSALVLGVTIGALALALSLAACTDEETTTSTSPPDVSTTVVTVADEAEPFPTPAYVAVQPVDLDAVENLDRVTLTATQREVLARQGFVAAATDIDGWYPYKFWHVYEEGRYGGVPLLVTTDSVLNAYHTVFDTLLQHLEEVAFSDQATAMSEALQAAASDQVNQATDPKAMEAALANEAYFAVGNSLLKGGLTAPDRVRDQVEAEIALIEAASGLETSPVLGYMEDYTQYTPRGHYTHSEGLTRYFKAMMWYGHTAFWVDPKSPDVDEALARRLTRQAALIATALSGETEIAWKALYEPTTFMVGAADDLTAADIRPAMGVALGTQTPTPDDLADDATVDALRAELRKLPAPRILSHLAFDEGSQEDASRSFRVMGQRYIPDSYAFQQMVWRHVGTEDKKRVFPMGLDAMAALGSDQAWEILVTTYGQNEFENYESQFWKVKAQFDTRSDDVWPPTLYTGWLDGLALVMAFPPDGAPALMKTDVWARKALNAALGSWTELRHDTILYAKQSVIAEGDGGEEMETAGYVEPYPAFYGHMAELADATKDGIAAYDLLDDTARQKLDAMADLCRRLESIAEKELAGVELTQEEEYTILYYGSELEELELFYAEDGRTLSPTDEKSPVVADVHTDLTTQQVLEEGTGFPLPIYAVLEVDGRLQVMMGAAYSYYEFLVPMDERMTDEGWQAALLAGQAPPRPVWTDAWISD